MPANGLTSWITGASRSRKNFSIVSSLASLSSSKRPRPKVCVQGECTPSNTTYAPAHSIHSALLDGNRRRRAAAYWAQANPSARSRRCASARSEKVMRTSLQGTCSEEFFGPTQRGHPDGDGLVAMKDESYCAALRAIAFSVCTLCALSSRAWASGRKVSAF